MKRNLEVFKLHRDQSLKKGVTFVTDLWMLYIRHVVHAMTEEPIALRGALKDINETNTMKKISVLNAMEKSIKHIFIAIESTMLFFRNIVFVVNIV